MMEQPRVPILPQANEPVWACEREIGSDSFRTPLIFICVCVPHS